MTLERLRNRKARAAWKRLLHVRSNCNSSPSILQLFQFHSFTFSKQLKQGKRGIKGENLRRQEDGRTSGFRSDDNVFVDHVVDRFFLIALAGSLDETAGNESIVKNTYKREREREEWGERERLGRRIEVIHRVVALMYFARISR